MTTRSASLPAATDPELLVDAEDLRAVERHDLDRLDRREAGLDQQLEVALVAVTRAARRPRRWDRRPRRAGRRPSRTRARTPARAGTAPASSTARRAPTSPCARSDIPRALRAPARRARDPRAAGDRDTTARRRRASTTSRPCWSTISRIVCCTSGPSIDTFSRLVAHVRRAVIRRAVRDVVAVGEQAVLEVVDAERDRLAERDRAEVAGELQPALVRGLDRGAERFAADVGVGLEPGHAFVGPVVDDPPRFLGRCRSAPSSPRRRARSDTGR